MSTNQFKKCPKCGEEKPLSEFYIDNRTKDGYRCYCKQCIKKYKQEHKKEICKQRKKYYQKHKEEIKKHNKKYYQEHIEEIREQTKKYQKAHKEEIREQTKKYLEEHKEERRKYKQEHKKERRKYLKERRKNDSNFKTLCLLRSRINNAIKKQHSTKAYKTIELLGCTIQKVRDHLESQFTEGMTWNNHGLFGWHIDHIKPCASFDLTDPEQQKQCFHYTNLQPLWAKDNLKKGFKWDSEKKDTNN